MANPNPNVKVNARTIDLAYTALAWKSPQLLRIILITVVGAFSAAFLGLLVSPLLAEAPVFSSKSRKAMKYFDYCFAKVQLDHPELSTSKAFTYCQNTAEIYKQEL